MKLESSSIKKADIQMSEDVEFAFRGMRKFSGCIHLFYEAGSILKCTDWKHRTDEHAPDDGRMA